MLVEYCYWNLNWANSQMTHSLKFNSGNMRLLPTLQLWLRILWISKTQNLLKCKSVHLIIPRQNTKPNFVHVHVSRLSPDIHLNAFCKKPLLFLILCENLYRIFKISVVLCLVPSFGNKRNSNVTVKLLFIGSKVKNFFIKTPTKILLA